MSLVHPDPSSTVADPARLAAVLRTGLSGTAAEETFDRMTRLATRLTGAPVSFFSLVSEDHDFFKSCHGVPGPLATSRVVTGRTFCHYSILRNEPMRVSDARTDVVLRNIPTVKTLGVVAYLGIPLQLSTGERIGSMCVVDFMPREWSDDDVEVLQELAASALREVELRISQNERSRSLEILTSQLRDPLTIVQLNVDLVEEDLPAERGHDRITRIREACERMESGLRRCLELHRSDPM